MQSQGSPAMPSSTTDSMPRTQIRGLLSSVKVKLPTAMAERASWCMVAEKTSRFVLNKLNCKPQKAPGLALRALQEGVSVWVPGFVARGICVRSRDGASFGKAPQTAGTHQIQYLDLGVEPGGFASLDIPAEIRRPDLGSSRNAAQVFRTARCLAPSKSGVLDSPSITVYLAVGKGSSNGARSGSKRMVHPKRVLLKPKWWLFQRGPLGVFFGILTLSGSCASGANSEQWKSQQESEQLPCQWGSWLHICARDFRWAPSMGSYLLQRVCNMGPSFVGDV